MALSDILGRILEEAREEAGKIRDRGEEEVEKVRAEARGEADTLLGDLVRQGEEDLRRQRENELSAARLQGRKEVLALKKALLDELFREVPPLLRRGPASDYARVLCEFIDERAAALPGKLEAGSEDVEQYGEGFASLVVEALTVKYPGCRLTPSERPGSFKWGIVIRTGEVVHNFSLESLLSEVRGRLEGAAAQALFAP